MKGSSSCHHDNFLAATNHGFPWGIEQMCKLPTKGFSNAITDSSDPLGGYNYCLLKTMVGWEEYMRAFTPKKYHFLENKYQLAINARTPVEEIQIDGLTLRTMRYNFTPITATGNIEATVFSEVASEFYSLTPADIMDGQVLLPVLHKLSEPKECTITLKAHMYKYVGSAK